MNGWIRLDRSLLDWQWHADPNTVTVFIHLLLMANFKDSEWQSVGLKAGQTIISIDSLAHKTGLTEKQTRVALSHLKRAGSVATKGTNKYTVVTITNWDLYQHQSDDDGEQKGEQNGKQMANKGQTKGEQEGNSVTKNKGNKGNKETKVVVRTTAHHPERWFSEDGIVRYEYSDKTSNVLETDIKDLLVYGSSCGIPECESSDSILRSLKRNGFSQGGIKEAMRITSSDENRSYSALRQYADAIFYGLDDSLSDRRYNILRAYSKALKEGKNA